MRIVVILAHPDEESFNHAIAKTACASLFKNGHEVIFHDLYREQFDPILPKAELASDACLEDIVQSHCQEIAHADGIILVHPNWWGQPPAILKGWIDRVFRPGIAYRFLPGDSGEGIPVGLLKAHTAVIFNTSNTQAIRESNVFGDPLQKLWETCVLQFCGVSKVVRRMFSVVITSTPEERASWLAEVTSIIEKNFPLSTSLDEVQEKQSANQ